MYIITKLKLDQKQQPYWSCMLMNGTECVREVHSQVFDPVDKFQYWQMYERCFIRMAKEIAREPDQVVIMHMLTQEDVIPTNQSNRS